MAKAWSGTVSFKENSNKKCLVLAQTGVGNICAGEYLVQGEQHKGLSGAAVLNGCGYIGIAHAVLSDSDARANFAGVISASMIKTFLDKVIDNLMNASDCNVTTLEIPTLPINACNG